ncbi:hypothetical protein LOK49_LG11G00540 [Camellia lanceoleosa]|uniref:Uncharacterized protein n=1 Tax=Camellia lanceoleosa TaxID=1840588 RepID=A0ACC0FZB9_9ERIC|nr:hypothetical protein LOK49_LG11G00540 [Camellia lanceoleosa]
MEQCRLGKLAKWIRKLGKRISSEDWVWGSQSHSQTSRLALNVKVKKFNQAQVNGGSNYDPFKQNHSEGNRLGRISGEGRPC